MIRYRVTRTMGQDTAFHTGLGTSTSGWGVPECSAAEGRWLKNEKRNRKKKRRRKK